MTQLTEARDIIWLAGLLEGEGCFGLQQRKYPRITLGMTDEDIVIRAATLMKSRVTRCGNMYRTYLDGAYAVGWMMTLYTLLGIRRRKAIVDVIKVWKEYLFKRPANGIKVMAKCHPDRVMHAFGLCNICYCSQWKEKRLLKKRAELMELSVK